MREAGRRRKKKNTMMTATQDTTIGWSSLTLEAEAEAKRRWLQISSNYYFFPKRA
jgi:hypothetical protein